MGIDARMFVRVKRDVSDIELKTWSYRLGSMARTALFLGHDTEIFHRPLERIEVYEQDGEDIEPDTGETFLNVSLSGRYYGEEYERGPLLIYIGIAEFLECLIPGCEVWYGGDSSGVCAEPFGRARRTELLQHAALVAKDPYIGAFDHADVTDRPCCPVCDMPMSKCGYGKNYALFRCEGCGWEEQQHGDVHTRGFHVSAEARR